MKRLLPRHFGTPQEQRPPAPAPPPGKTERRDGPGLKILVVDDDPAILELYTEILSKAGFEVRKAEDASGAVTLFQDFRPALVVLDVDMPAGGGRKVFERLRVQLASPAPVLFCTASPASVADLEKGPNVMVLKKPVTPGVLAGAVKDLLGLA